MFLNGEVLCVWSVFCLSSLVNLFSQYNALFNASLKMLFSYAGIESLSLEIILQF